jgi:transposase, IS5 family
MYICQEPDRQQLEIFERSLPFDGKLDRGNRWIRLAHTLNWRELELSYAKLFAADGRPGIRARYVLGTLILKHQFQMSDEETLQMILESPYCQYFIGLAQFAITMPFEVSSLSRVRERLGDKTFQEFEQTLIATLVEKKLIQPKGLQVDATVYESDITYPTDCGLLEKARTFCVKQIGQLSQVVNKKVRTYCRVARKAYLNFSKKKHKTHQQIRRMQKSILQYPADAVCGATSSR